MRTLITTFILLVFVAGCSAPISKKAESDLAAPVDCTTAAADIRTLNAEKAHVGTEIMNGATSIIPIGLVVHLVKRDEKNSFKVGTGQYNRALDKKIAEIKKQCNVM